MFAHTLLVLKKILRNFRCMFVGVHSFEKHLYALFEKSAAWLAFLAEKVCLDFLPKSVSIHNHAAMMTPSSNRKGVGITFNFVLSTSWFKCWTFLAIWNLKNVGGCRTHKQKHLPYSPSHSSLFPNWNMHCPNLVILAHQESQLIHHQ